MKSFVFLKVGGGGLKPLFERPETDEKNASTPTPKVERRNLDMRQRWGATTSAAAATSATTVGSGQKNRRVKTPTFFQHSYPPLSSRRTLSSSHYRADWLPMIGASQSSRLKNWSLLTVAYPTRWKILTQWGHGTKSTNEGRIWLGKVPRAGLLLNLFSRLKYDE